MRSLLTLLLLSLAEPATGADLLLNGSFERLDTGQPVGWRAVEGARSGQGSKSSSWFIGRPGIEGLRSLKLSGTDDTARWMGLQSESFPVQADRRLRLSAMMKTEDVHQAPSQFAGCHVGLRFEDAAGELLRSGGQPIWATPVLLGTRDWLPVERHVRVPPDAVQAHVLCFLSMSGSAWFDDVRVEAIAEPPWRRTESGRFVFFDLEGARLPEAARAANARNLADLEAELGLRGPETIEYYRYPDNALKGAITGRPGNAHVELGHEIHSVWDVDRHELVHVVVAPVGPPQSLLLSEGLAVHLAGDWLGRPLDDRVTELHAEGRLPRLRDLVESRAFRSVGEEVSYPTAGSFVRHLIASSGLPSFKQVYPRYGRRDDLAAFEERLQAIYGRSLEELEAAWLASVLGDGPDEPSPTEGSR